MDNTKKEDLTDKIKELFDSIGCKPLVILKTKKAGEEVDNGYGIEFPLPEYAVIHKGDIYDDEKFSKLCEFETRQLREENNYVDIHYFRDKRCFDGIYLFTDELNRRDGYEIVYEKFMISEIFKKYISIGKYLFDSITKKNQKWNFQK